MSPLVIIGAGGHGREVLDVVEALNAVDEQFELLGFLDDGPVDELLLVRRSAPLLGGVDTLEDLDARYVIGVGDSATRARIDATVSAWGCTPVTLVHPLASVASDNELGPGVLLAAGARVTTNVHLGRHTQLNVNAVVSHDCRVADYVTLSPGALVNGAVTIGDGVFVGTGAVIAPGVTVGANAVIGAGAVVLDDVEAETTVVGVPARPR